MIGSCLVGCESSASYLFNLYKFISGTNQWSLFTNSSYYFTSGQSNTGFSILKYLFSDNLSQTIWKVELVINAVSIASTNQSFQGKASMQILVNFPPLPGVCEVFPKEGNTTTIFNIFCDLWTDTDGIIKKYVFYGIIYHTIILK